MLTSKLYLSSLRMSEHNMTQVVVSEFEHGQHSKDRHLQTVIDENNDLRVQLFDAKEESAHFSNECRQLSSELQDSKASAAKLEEELLLKSAQLEVCKVLISRLLSISFEPCVADDSGPICGVQEAC